MGREVVHRTFARDALLLLTLDATESFSLTVRGPHNVKPINVGDLVSQQGYYGDRVDTAPSFIIKLSDLFAINGYEPRLLQNAVLSLEAGEAYRIERLLPIDDQWQPVEVTRMDAEDVSDLPTPEAA